MPDPTTGPLAGRKLVRRRVFAAEAADWRVDSKDYVVAPTLPNFISAGSRELVIIGAILPPRVTRCQSGGIEKPDSDCGLPRLQN